jgi:hypothetical protein
MPMLDAYIPEGALTPQAERRREQARALLEAAQAKPSALA